MRRNVPVLALLAVVSGLLVAVSVGRLWEGQQARTAPAESIAGTGEANGAPRGPEASVPQPEADRLVWEGLSEPEKETVTAVHAWQEEEKAAYERMGVRERANAPMQQFGLSNIPEEAEEVKAKTVGNLFAREHFIRFRAGESALRTWVDSSASFRSGKWTEGASADAIVAPEEMEWFAPAAGGEGVQSHRIRAPKGEGGCQVFIDRSQGFVFVYISLG